MDSPLFNRRENPALTPRVVVVVVTLPPRRHRWVTQVLRHAVESGLHRAGQMTDHLAGLVADRQDDRGIFFEPLPAQLVPPGVGRVAAFLFDFLLLRSACLLAGLDVVTQVVREHGPERWIGCGVKGRTLARLLAAGEFPALDVPPGLAHREQLHLFLERLLRDLVTEDVQPRPGDRQKERRRDTEGSERPVVNRDIAPAPHRVFFVFERALGANKRECGEYHDEQAGEVDPHVLVFDRRSEARCIDMIEGEGDGEVIESLCERRAIVAGGERRVELFLKRLGGFDVECAGLVFLDAPLDVLVVRKLGAPFQPELALGAIASGQVRVLNEQLLEQIPGIDDAVIDCSAGCEADFNETSEMIAYADRFLYFNANGFYSYTGADQTKYKRKIIVTNLTATSVSVKVEVYWDDKTLSVEERLHNWK